MAEIYSSLYKGNVHITQKFSSSHKALDMGNYKTRNAIYSPNKLGNGTVQSVTTSYKSPATGLTYQNTLVVWIKYDNGMRTGMYHGQVNDKVVNTGDRVVPGQQIYRTGNTGNSKGDHLHINVQDSSNVNVDPVKWVIDDKFILIPNGTRLEITSNMNVRSANFNIIGGASKGSVCEVVSYYKYNSNYYWYKVKFANKDCYIADTTLNKVSTAPVTNIDGSKPIGEIDTLYRKIAELELIIEAQDREIDILNKQRVEWEKEREELLRIKEQVKTFSISLGELQKVK